MTTTATIDNGDGTGTRIVYNADGTVASTETITGLPIPEPDPDPVAELLAALPAATLEETNDILAQVLALIGGN